MPEMHSSTYWESRMILKNSIRTPDGTVLESWSRHDYVTHLDKNGKTYMVDGGLDYLRRSAHGDEVDLSLSADPETEHEFCREHFMWGTYGKDGKGPFRRIALKDMSDGHIRAVLRTQNHIDSETRLLFENEILYRAKQ